MEKNRLWIMLGVVLVLGGLTTWVYWPKKSEQAEKVTAAWKKFDKTQITKIVIARPKVSETQPELNIELEKKGDQWVMLKPAQGPADPAAITGALDELSGMVAKDVLTKNTGVHSNFDIEDAKAVKVQLFAGGTTAFEVLIGKDLANGSAVRLPGTAVVQRTDKFLAVLFGRNANEWRNKEIVKIARDKVKSVEWTTPNGTYKFDRNGETWVSAAGSPVIERLDTAKLNTLITESLLALSADSFANEGDNGGIDANGPHVTLTVDGTPATITLRAGAERDGSIAVKRDDQPVIYRVPATRKAALTLDLTAVQAPPPPPPVNADGGVGDAAVVGGDAGVAMGGDAAAAAPPSMGTPLTLDQLPPEIRARLEEAQRRAAQGAPTPAP